MSWLYRKNQIGHLADTLIPVADVSMAGAIPLSPSLGPDHLSVPGMAVRRHCLTHKDFRESGPKSCKLGLLKNSEIFKSSLLGCSKGTQLCFECAVNSN